MTDKTKILEAEAAGDFQLSIAISLTKIASKLGIIAYALAFLVGAVMAK